MDYHIHESWVKFHEERPATKLFTCHECGSRSPEEVYHRVLEFGAVLERLHHEPVWFFSRVEVLACILAVYFPHIVVASVPVVFVRAFFPSVNDGCAFFLFGSPVVSPLDDLFVLMRELERVESPHISRCSPS